MTIDHQNIDIIKFIDFIQMMHGAATYYQDIGKLPHEFIKESNILDINLTFYNLTT